MRGLYRIVTAVCLLVFFPGQQAFATHNRAGEITYKQLSDLTFEFTITTFTYTLSAADRSELEVDWGDNTTARAPRVSLEYLPNFYKRNVYVIRHTFPGPGVYQVVVQDPNRNYGVKNIPNSVNVIFSVKTTLIVNPGIGLNSTPVLLNPPYDKAALGHVFIHNPGAFDRDGDSISYKLTVCTREDGKPIENYTLPPSTDTLFVDPVTGDFVWDTPADTGIYNVAIDIEEWRNGIKIGNVVRDMQIEVYTTDNNPPLNDPLQNFCVEAGDTVEWIVRATDPDGDEIMLFASGGPFVVGNDSARFDVLSSAPGEEISRFRWVTSYGHVRHQPYDVLIKSEDQNEDLKLVDIDNFNIKVLGPPPVLTEAVPANQSVQLQWEKYPADSISGFAIYRRVGLTSFIPDSCTDGLPETLGFEKIGEAEPGDTGFLDTGSGQGLDQGNEYSYRITALFNNRDESKVSNEVSAILISGTPVLTQASIQTTDNQNGDVLLSWAKPRELDTLPQPPAGPFVYLIYRAPGLWGEDYQLIDSLQTPDLNDTIYLDTGPVNTADQGLTYKIALYNNESGNRYLINTADEASTTFLNWEPGDEKIHLSVQKSVPWIVTRYDYYRLNESTMVFDSIGTSVDPFFTDTNLVNGNTYCYRVRTTGTYNKPGLPKGFLNFSQEVCAIPVDNEAPCIPQLNVASNCDSLYNQLSWSFESPLCLEDVEGYRLFYRRTRADDYQQIQDIGQRELFEYKHFPGDIVSGCYRMLAYDDNGNESPYSLEICVDSCNFYEIPNVFTPNNDRRNDVLRAKTTPLVERVVMKIYSRSGVLVYETNDPEILWDGTYKGEIVAPGIYYYHCEVFERRVFGVVQFHLSGFIHLITEKGVTIEDIEF